uniref:MARVEL domain-containing protein n=1 Tax=Steinernema glaseri TaxID=37863 RepID=A0A1I8A734_9BILA
MTSPSFISAAGIIVAFVEFLLVVLAVYGLIYNYYIFGSSYLLWFIVGIISVIIILIAIVLLLYAIKKESARLLFPHLSAQPIEKMIFTILMSSTTKYENWELIQEVFLLMRLLCCFLRCVERSFASRPYQGHFGAGPWKETDALINEARNVT